LFPPGNQHSWLYAGMLFVSLFSLIGIWAYVHSISAAFKNVN
jgi:hypothetical protein